MQKDNRLVVYVEPAMLAWIKARADEHGSPMGEVIRRAVQQQMSAERVVNTPTERKSVPLVLVAQKGCS